MSAVKNLPPYRHSIAGSLLAAREATMAPIRPLLRAANFTEQQWRVLRVLSDGGPLDVASLAERAMLHGPSVTRILKELGDRGLTARELDKADRRRSIVDITPAGREAIDETAAHTVLLINRYVEAFGRERLTALLDELAAFQETLAPFAPEAE
ncbi:MarR family transcriptional regulator [Sphingopyxis terrae]|jgi:homoprotocatechuate degradation regulator HpaR|uniref:MarR family transcriptional regulator n=1 Tax=Sphingopyxis terrae TaxID=33052 RepID=UPI0007894A0D|nr:MarR family transcriptional regulator [Sphingopyxis terrae]